MIVTEKEAAEKWCPKFRAIETAYDTYHNYGSNRDGLDRDQPLRLSTPHCIGSRCMAWRWSFPAVRVTEIYDDMTRTSESDRVGHCGAFGKIGP